MRTVLNERGRRGRGRGEDGRPAPDEAAGVRKLLFAVVLVGIAGLSAELVLLEHWDEWLQWAPFGGLALAFAATSAAWARPRAATIRALQAAMGLLLALGALGIWLHYRGNALFELEMDPSARGWGLFRTALFGATPLLAPGALVQIALVGLIATFRHPALSGGAPPGSAGGAPPGPDGRA